MISSFDCTFCGNDGEIDGDEREREEREKKIEEEREEKKDYDQRMKERKSDHHLVPGQFIIGKKRAKSGRKKEKR